MSTQDSTADLLRMSHTLDPDTSHDAARRARTGSKVTTIQNAIVVILSTGPATAKELHREYFLRRRAEGWPSADLQDIRRRLTELKLDAGRVVDTRTRRNGEAVMALAEVVAA